MSFLKKLGRKVGGKRANAGHNAREDDARAFDAQGINITTSSSTQSRSEATPGSSGVGLTARSEPHLQEGLFRNAAALHTVNISGGTFTDIGSQIVNVHNQYIVNDDGESKLFAMLNPVAAAHDCQEVTNKVTECFAGTRHQLLQDIEKWRTGDSSVPIFILDGIAGIGKTTVVKTVCARAAADHRLAGSWFFSRDQQDRKSTRGFVGTLAFQLAKYHPALRDRITQALKDHPDVLQKAIRVQFDTLIHEPLQAVLRELGGTHSISIDAIDECDLNEATEILSVLLGTAPKLPQLRLLITCRPERPFRLLLQRHRGPHIFHLHEIENSVVESDIRLYINHRLSPEQVDEALPDLLPPPWRVSEKEKEALVQMAGKLFIVASTAVNFILDPRRLSPAKQIRQLLDATGSGLASSPMDRLYTQVLRAAVPDPIDDWFDDYQVVVGAIVVAADVLPVQSLASLLDKEPNDIVRTLSHLHSLIAPTTRDEAFRVHHKSFPDFVTDPSRCSIDSRFLIDPSRCHFHLARSCLRVMLRMLKQNICEIPLSDWSKEKKELAPGTLGRIPPELAYACAYWISHFQQGISHFTQDVGIVDQLKRLVEEHLLSWLEILALTGRFGTAWNSVDMLSTLIGQCLPASPPATSGDLSNIINVLQDCLRFLNLHPDIPQSYPMQIYHSALAFAPNGSLISRLYSKSLSKESVAIISGVDQGWGPMIISFSGGGLTADMQFSPCGEMVAIASGRIRLYNAKSGSHIRQFYPQDSTELRYDTAIAFSPDGSYIAGGNGSGVCIWAIASGALIGAFSIPLSQMRPLVYRPHHIRRLHSQELGPTSMNFTQDGTALVAGARDGTAFLWQMQGDGQPQVLKTNKHEWDSTCDCPAGALLDTCSTDSIINTIAIPGSRSMAVVTKEAVQFWNLNPPEITNDIRRRPAIFQDMETDICPVSVSRDRRMLATETSTFDIRVYATRNPRIPVAILSGYHGGITTIAFGYQLEQLCSAGRDMTVRLWDIAAATQLRKVSTSCTLSNAMFVSSVNKFILVNGTQIFQLEEDATVPLGMDLPADLSSPFGMLRLSPDGSNLAMHDPYATTFANLQDLIAAGPGSRPISRWPAVRFLPTGEFMTIDIEESPENICNVSLPEGSCRVSITPETGQEAQRAFLVQGSAGERLLSPDGSRVALLGPGFSVSISSLLSGQLEAYLPGAAEACHKDPHVVFSWDSNTVYVARYDGFYYAQLVPSSRTGSVTAACNEGPPAMPPRSFSRYHGIPIPDWFGIGGNQAPPSISITLPCNKPSLGATAR
ncbi:hypothetical protein BKA70DRAFT_486643 [Coprinopsis sp. MPI-PUGE-AT-0042]|nr:hypothetical protein BKA70DRAFT_486643 [Coprinopsis sp. MPI-PUGE-AT-0042]